MVNKNNGLAGDAGRAGISKKEKRMSTLQHINSVVNYSWPEMSRRYPGFEKPQIVPAEKLRGLAPVYLRSAID